MAASSKKIGLLRRLRRRLTPAILEDIYLHSIRPTLEYANIVWSGLTTSDIHRLERVTGKLLVSSADQHLAQK